MAGACKTFQTDYGYENKLSASGESISFHSVRMESDGALSAALQTFYVRVDAGFLNANHQSSTSSGIS